MDSRDFDALEAAAHQRLPAGAAAFLECGADDEITAKENASAWRLMRLRPRVFRDIRQVDTSLTVLGKPSSMPILVAPMGKHKLYHPEAEAASARGAAMAGTIFTMPTASAVTIEALAKERKTAPQWFQLYMPPDRAVTEGLIDRISASGFSALVLTVDQSIGGSSPRAVRSPIIPSPDVRDVNLPGAPLGKTAYDVNRKGLVHSPTTFQDLEWLVKRCPLPIIVKGVLRGDDALRALDCGAKAIVVSNHGGRHLDTTVTSAEALGEVVAAVKGRTEIYVDGGIRRGTDILKALALGARAVLVGRPALWGLTTGGADGVAGVLTHLQDELSRTMQLCGAAKLADITPDLVAARAGFANAHTLER